ncbi:MAG TPA: ABC transporter ATP-binding protein [Gemmatimonadota bacterium]|nr:ABC transporter ATP-binding protein [Gemmatimonadota bacterium]
MTSVLRVQGLSKSFGDQEVLREVELEIAAREILVVLGPSGCGKTTLLRILAGLEQPDAGEILLEGRSASRVPPQDRRFGVVFQDQALFEKMTCERNIAFGLEVRGVSTGRLRERVERMLELVRLVPHRHKLPAQLSGGQRQRVALARALAYEPKVMLFDEPFTALDARTRVELRREVRRILNDADVAALFITHDQEEALELADRILVLNGGQVEQVGTPYDVYNRPGNEFVATFLGAANVLLGRWSEGQTWVLGTALNPPDEGPALVDGQPIKIVFRPEDVEIGFRRDLLAARHPLSDAVVEFVSYVGPTERLTVRLSARLVGATSATDVVDIAGLPIIVTRTKWEAEEVPLEVGDPVVLALRSYRLLPHYPLGTQSGAETV